MKNIFLNEKEDISKQATVGQDADNGKTPWASPICCQAEAPYYMLYNVVISGGNIPVVHKNIFIKISLELFFLKGYT